MTTPRSWSTRLLLAQNTALYLAVALAWFGWWMRDPARLAGGLGQQALVGIVGGLSVAIGIGGFTVLSSPGVRDYRRLPEADRRRVDDALRTGARLRSDGLREVAHARADALLPSPTGAVIVIGLLVLAGAYLVAGAASPPLWYVLAWVLAVAAAVVGFVVVRRYVPDGVREVQRRAQAERG